MSRISLALARAILGRPEVDDGDWDHKENLTLINLSQQLHQPSPTLARKYSTPIFSRASQKLADFMAEQAEMARRAALPPSPPSTSNKPNSIYNTPQKGHGATLGFDGYLTPPITPDGHQFGTYVVKSSYPYPNQYPITPTHHNSATLCPPHAQQYAGYMSQHGAD